MKLNKGEYLIYTDGSCRGQIGGWGFIILKGGRKIHGYGSAMNTTSNQCELLAACMALSCFSKNSLITLNTDSKYLQLGMTRYIHSWVKKEYKGSRGTKVKNVPLWKDLYNLDQKNKINWQWVKGHNGNEYNGVAHDLANKGRLHLEFSRLEPESLSIHNFTRINTEGTLLSDMHIGGLPYIYED